MTLVGSLVWFLVTVVYQGDYSWRLRWILGCFVFAAVLIARISMRGDISARAWLYGIALAIPTWLGMQFFVDYPEDIGLKPWTWALNILFLGIVWWCAHRLTKDCTQLEDEEEQDSEGLLQAAGLEKPVAAAAEETADGEAAAKLGWWQRYRQYRERQKK